MKKFTVILCFLISGLSIAQENVDDKEVKYPQDVNKKHELKINAFSLLVVDWFDVSYEYLINNESSFGVGTLISFNNESDIYRNFSLTPYYRRYFSEKYARGFFVEGFGMIHNYDTDLSSFFGSNEGQNVTEFAVGISVGGKFITKRGFTAEIYIGMGRNLARGENSIEAVGRGGVSLGYRF